MQETTNTFSEGLVMDFAPESTKNNCLTNALNATLITMNGNELQLQNDMGNSRVQGAELPEGYVPLGTTQLGGIIYIVSYNPKEKKCQVGSFPSPKRYNSTDNKNTIETINREGTQQILLTDQVFNPGDEFIFTSFISTEDLLDYYIYPDEPIKDENGEIKYEEYKYRFIKPSVGLLTEDNKLIKLDLDYKNIFANKVEEGVPKDCINGKCNPKNYSIIKVRQSGRLVLVLEKVLVHPIIYVACLESAEGDIILYVNTILNSSDLFYEKGIHIEISFLENNLEEVFYSQDIDKVENSSNYYTEVNLPRKAYEKYQTTLKKIIKDAKHISKYIKINITPRSYINCKNDKEEVLLNSCTASTVIDLHKVNSGLIELPVYNYAISDTQAAINYSVNAFLKSTQKYIGTSYNIKYIDGDKESEYYTDYQSIPQSGTLIIPFNDKFTRNNLYIIKFKITISETGASNVDTYIKRWLFTNNLFNQYSGKDINFDERQPELSIYTDENITYQSEITNESDLHKGIYIKTTTLSEEDTKTDVTYALVTTMSNNTIKVYSDYADVKITNIENSSITERAVSTISTSLSNNGKTIHINNFQDTVTGVKAVKKFSIKQFDVDNITVFCPIAYNNDYANYITSGVTCKAKDYTDNKQFQDEQWKIGSNSGTYDKFKDIQLGNTYYYIGDLTITAPSDWQITKNAADDIYILALAQNGTSTYPCLVKTGIQNNDENNDKNNDKNIQLVETILKTIYTQRNISVAGFTQANPVDSTIEIKYGDKTVTDESIPVTIVLNNITIDVNIGGTTLSDLKNKLWEKDMSDNNVTLIYDKDYIINTSVYRQYKIPNKLKNFKVIITDYIAIDQEGEKAYFINAPQNYNTDSNIDKYKIPYYFNKQLYPLNIHSRYLTSFTTYDGKLKFNPSVISYIDLFLGLPYLVFIGQETSLATLTKDGSNSYEVMGVVSPSNLYVNEQNESNI